MNGHQASQYTNHAWLKRVVELGKGASSEGASSPKHRHCNLKRRTYRTAYQAAIHSTFQSLAPATAALPKQADRKRSLPRAREPESAFWF